MKKILTFLLLSVVLLSPATFGQKGSFTENKQLQGPQNPRLGFIIHGGAGTIKRGSMTPEKEKEFRDKLTEALLAGYKALQDGKNAGHIGFYAPDIVIKRNMIDSIAGFGFLY